MSGIHRNPGHPGFHQRQVGLLALFHGFHRNGFELGGVVPGVFQNRQTAQNPAGSQHLASHGANDVLQAEAVGVRVVTLGAGEFAQPDGHHFEQAAFDLAGEIGVPLDAAHQHDAIGFVSHAVHEGFDAVGGLAERDHFQLAHQRASHGGFGDAVVGQHVGLSLRGGRAVTAHGGKQERPHALFLPVAHHAADNRGDVVDAAAAHADGDARARFHSRGKTAGR